MGAGALLSLANPPPDAGPVAFVALIPLLWASRGVRPRRGAWYCFAFGLTYYGILMYWLLPFGVIAWFPLVLSQAGFAALFGLLLPLMWRARRPVRSAVAAAALWTAVDWARGTWPLGGFTWGGLGYTQHGNHLLLPLASVTGVWGVTFVVVVVNALLLEAFHRVHVSPLTRTLDSGVRPRPVVAVGLLALAAAVTLAPAAIPLPAARGRALRVAVVQGNVPRELTSDRLIKVSVVGENHMRLHRQLASNPPDLAVWPENALADDPTVDPILGAEVADSIRTVGSPTLVGAIRETPDHRYFNQVLLYTGQGQAVGRYIKIHLVPFGEYVPWHSLFRWTERYRRGNADLVAGHTIRLFDVAGLRVGTPICFENAYPDLFRRFVARGAQVMVVSTNDSSFLESVASREHVIMSQLRAVENGRWVVQAALSGHSAIVDPHGRVTAETALFTQTILERAVPSSSARTIYSRLGDWFPWACGLAIVVVLAAFLRSSRGRRARTSAGEGGPGRDAGSSGAPPAGEREDAAAPAPVSGGALRTLVVLPTYNERETIGRVLEGVLAAGPEVEALVVDDGSPDGTADLVEQFADSNSRVRLVRRPGKQGLASAYLLGFRKGLEEGYDIMVEMDSDLSHRPEDLPKLLAGAERHDLTIGSRYVAGGGVSNWSRARLALSKAGNLYARTMLGFRLTDATSGYRAYRRAVLEALVPEGVTSDGYGFQIEIAYRAWRKGFSVAEVPIVFREREFGASKMSGRIAVEAMLNVARWGLRDGFNLGRRRSPTAPGG